MTLQIDLRPECFIFPTGWYRYVRYKRFISHGSNNRHHDLVCEKIRIYHKCEGRLEKSVLRITVWHNEACPAMPNGDYEGRIFLSYSRTNNGFFSLFFWITVKYCILCLKRLPEVPEYTEMWHVMMTQHNN